MISEKNSVCWKDPVSDVSLRFATQKDINEAEGGGVWRALSSPWHLICKIMGTAVIAFQGTNALKWTPPAPQKWVNQFMHKYGLSPETVFMETINNFIIGNTHRIFGSPSVMKAILKPHRNDKFFKNGIGTEQFLSLLQRTFPDDKLTEEDLMITCSKDLTAPYRKLLMHLLKKSKITEFTPQIRIAAQEMLKNWQERSEKGETINVSQETRLFTSQVICLLIFGDGSYAKEAAEAINFFNTFSMKSMVRKDTKEDNEKFEEAMKTFRNAVDKVLEDEHMTPLFEQENDLSPAQKKAMIFLIFFAGEETAASLLTWDLFQLAKNSDLQEELYQDLGLRNKSLLNDQEIKITKKVEQFFIQKFAEHPPAYGIARSVKENLCLEYKLEGEEVCRKKIFYKGEMVMPHVMKRGLQELELNNEDLKEQDFTPFGWGVHRCPGADLAKAEILTFLFEAIMNYTLHTEQKEDIERTGAITLQFVEDIHLTIKPRSSSN